jgi:hypothetical protein
VGELVSRSGTDGGGYIAQRIFSAKNEKHSLGATLWFNIAHYALRPWPWIAPALVALVLLPGPSATQDRLRPAALGWARFASVEEKQEPTLPYHFFHWALGSC